MAQEELPPQAEIAPENAWVWRAWHRLHNDRPFHGGGMGPAVPGDIPWTVVRTWARHHQMTRGEFAMLDQLLQAMDREYRSWWIDRQPPPVTT